MNKFVILSTAMLLTAMSGCWVCSKHPYYFDNQVFRDDRLIGEWVTGLGEGDKVFTENPFYGEPYGNSYNIESYTITADEDDETGYILTYIDPDGLSGTFSLHLATFEGITIVDIVPITLPEYDFNDSMDPRWLWHLRGHGCFVIDKITDNVISFRTINGDQWGDQLEGYESETFQVTPTTTLDSLIIPSEDLQAMIVEKSDCEDCWMPQFFARLEYYEEMMDKIENSEE